jgi:hypothetical protein
MGGDYHRGIELASPELSLGTQEKLGRATALYIDGKLTYAAFKVRCEKIIEEGETCMIGR